MGIKIGLRIKNGRAGGDLIPLRHNPAGLVNAPAASSRQRTKLLVREQQLVA